MIEKPAAHSDLTWHLRRLLEAVKGTACALEGRWRWLAAPMALVAWVLTRRERREAAAAMAQFQGMLEAFLGLLEDFRAGRLPECAPPEVDEEREEEGPATPALPRCAEYPAPCADSAAGPLQSRDHGRSGVLPSGPEAAEPLACERPPIAEVVPPRFSADATVNPAGPNVDCPQAATGAGLATQPILRFSLAASAAGWAAMAGSGSGMAMARKSLRFPFYLFAGQARAPPAAIFKSDVRVAASNRVDNVTIS